MVKICDICKIKEKKKEYMKKYQQRPDIKEKARKYYKIPSVREKRKEYLQIPEVKERIMKYEQRYRVKGRRKEYLKEYSKKYSKKSEVKEKARKYSKEYRSRQEVKERKKLRLKIDKTYNIIMRLRTRKNSALRQAIKTGKIPKDFNFMCVKIDYKKILEILKPYPQDISYYHIDDIFPFCKVDWNDIESIKKVLAPENHQWLKPKENQSKNGRYFKEEQRNLK